MTASEISTIADPTLVFWTVFLQQLPQILTALAVLGGVLVQIKTRREAKKDLEVVRKDAIVAAQKVETKVDENTVLTAHIAQNVVAKAEAAAAHVAQELQAKQLETDAKLLGLAETGDEIHGLVNSQTGKILLTVAELSRWKAESTKSPEHILAADKAEADYREHQRKQALVDAKEKVS